jgi:hypothetical protein
MSVFSENIKKKGQSRKNMSFWVQQKETSDSIDQIHIQLFLHKGLAKKSVRRKEYNHHPAVQKMSERFSK